MSIHAYIYTHLGIPTHIHTYYHVTKYIHTELNKTQVKQWCIFSCCVYRAHNVRPCFNQDTRYKMVSLPFHVYNYTHNTIHMYSGITSGRVLNGELLYTKILEVNLFAFAYRLFRRDFSPPDGTYCIRDMIHVQDIIEQRYSKGYKRIARTARIARWCVFMPPIIMHTS